MLSKTLSSRLCKVLEEIIHPDQICSIPGRKIQDNLHLIRNLIEYTSGEVAQTNPPNYTGLAIVHICMEYF